MPMTITHIQNEGVLLKGEGIVTGMEIKQANESIYSYPENLQKIRYQLCDYTNVSEIQISQKEVELLAEQDKRAAQLNPHMIIANVGKKDLLYGLIRMWEAYTDISLTDSTIESKAFRNIEDAEKWIEERIGQH